MKKALKIIGITLGIIVVLVAISGFYINVKGIPTYEVDAPYLQVELDSAKIARGEHLVAMVCADCHRGKGGKLEGAQMTDDSDPFGEIWAANITNHPEKGLGRYSDGEIAFLLRTGIKQDGSYTPPYMPKFPHLSDEDLESIIAYLRSGSAPVQASDYVPPASKPSFLTKMLCNVAFKPLPYPEEEILAPARTDKIAYGRYLATSAIDCYGCHSASFMTMDIMEPEKSEGFMGGGNELADSEKNPVLSANLTMHEQYGIGKWTEEEFKKAVRFGIKPDGTSLSDAMPKFSPMTDEELNAIWAWLKTVPVLENEVDRDLSDN